jgi:hypothetical protein
MKSSFPHEKFAASRMTILLLRAYSALLLVTLPLQIRAGFSGTDDHTPLEIVAALAVAFLQILTFIQFGSWFAMAYRKLTLVGAQPRYTPAMALVMFFVPFANLFRPTELFAELYGGYDPARLRPESRRRPVGSRVARFWWYGLLASSVVADIGTAVPVNDGESSKVHLFLLCLSQVFAACAALGATRFVRDIQDLQRRFAILLRLDKNAEASQLLEEESFRSTANVAVVLRFTLVLTAIFQAILLATNRLANENLNVVVIRPISLLSIVAIASSGIAFLIWVSRTITNIRLAGSFPRSAVFCVIGFLLPGYNLVHSWVLIQTIWTSIGRFMNETKEVVPGVFSSTLTEKNSRRSSLIDWWGLCSLVQLPVVVTLQRSRELELISREAVVATTLALSIVTILLLERIVRLISLRMRWLESTILRSTDPMTPIASRTLPPLPAARWSDVLFPIASSVEDGLREDTLEVRNERETAEKALEAQDAIAQQAHYDPRHTVFRERRAKEMAWRERQDAEDAQRRTIRDMTFTKATLLTRTLRILLLLALFVGFGEGCFLFGAYGDSHRSHNLPATWILLITSILLVVGAMLCGLPSWLTLSRWAAAQIRNGNAAGVFAADPARVTRQVLTFQEPVVFRQLLVGSRAHFSEASFGVWKVTLRMIQTAPVWLAVACAVGAYMAMAGVVVFILTLSVLLLETASYVRAVDTGFIQLYQNLADISAEAEPQADDH